MGSFLIMATTASARAITLVLILVTAPKLALADDYYVDPNGNDESAGTRDAPWRTLTKAGEEARPGDTVFLRGGEYRQGLRPARSGREGAPIVFRAVDGETPLIVDSDGPIAIDLNERSYIELRGVHVDGQGSFRESNFESWLTLDDAHHNVIAECNFRRAQGWAGVAIDGNSSFNVFVDNRMDENGTWSRRRDSDGTLQDAGDLIEMTCGHHNFFARNHLSRGGHDLFLVGGSYNVVRENHFDNDWGEMRGNRVTTVGAPPSHECREHGYNVFEHNVVRNAFVSVDSIRTASIKAQGVGMIVRFNTFVGAHNQAVSTPSRADIPVSRGIRIYHNTMYGNGGPAWEVVAFQDGVSDDNAFVNNIVFRNRQAPPSSNFDSDLIVQLAPSELGTNRAFSNAIVRARPGDAIVRTRAGRTSLEEAESSFGANFYDNLEVAPDFVTADPREHEDFQLDAGSALIDAGAFLTFATEGGSGTELAVDDAGYFCDGFEVQPGDAIRVGDAAVRIVGADYTRDTLTLERAIRWERGTPVTLDYAGAGPDIGAFERGLNENDCSCDDGDPCTADRCLDGTCTHEAIPACELDGGMGLDGGASDAGARDGGVGPRDNDAGASHPGSDAALGDDAGSSGGCSAAAQSFPLALVMLLFRRRRRTRVPHSPNTSP